MPKTKKATPEEIVLLWDNLDLTDKIKTFESIRDTLDKAKKQREEELKLLNSVGGDK